MSGIFGKYLCEKFISFLNLKINSDNIIIWTSIRANNTAFNPLISNQYRTQKEIQVKQDNIRGNMEPLTIPTRPINLVKDIFKIAANIEAIENNRNEISCVSINPNK